VGLVLCAAVAVVRRLGRGGGPAAFAAAIALAAVLTIPVTFSYDDGCNDHETVSPLGAVPLVAVAKPERSRGSYSDAFTLMACFER
jgi:hypothetical protein